MAIGLVMGLPNGMSPKAWAHSPTIHSAAPPTATAADATADLSFEVCIADRDGRCFTYSEGQIREVLRGQTFVQRALDDKAARKLVSRIESDLKNFPQSKAPCASTIRFVKSGQELKQVCRELLPRPQVQTWKALLKELEASTLK
ncbi:MAG TPA: hypothetical protein PLZ57_05640 [Pseudobdellovibrionaceae bacterium]|nr:hypothetical protein [Pseudobdellovibrionaceae bacterium]